jgi:membrane-bound lytic murein transglycosylase A
MFDFAQDNHERALAPFIASLLAPLPASPSPLLLALVALLPKAQAAKNTAKDAKRFFETHFTPSLVPSQGFLTGYYEPEVLGSRLRSARFNTPLYKTPEDLIALTPEAGSFNARSKAVNREGKPYFTRGEIEAGALQGRGLELVYLENANEAFFIAIQGSCRVRLHEGGVMRVGYAAHNGQPYTAIGRVLAERNIAPKEQITMSFLRGYLAQDEMRAAELRAQNASYVFFKAIEGLTQEQGPLGAQSVPLTPQRSLAIDKALYPYGLPIYVESFLPTDNLGTLAPFHRLMIAQDTGSAIRGAARGDVYLGSGFEAGLLAGQIRHEARFTLLLPKGYKQP